VNRLLPTLAAAAARGDPRPDAALLARFRADRDDAAFAALVARHAPAVRAACRVWLRNPDDVDDAAQATFFVLARRAETVHDGAAVGGWLLRVAENVARRLGKQARPLAVLPIHLPARDLPPPDDLGDALAEEVARLPEKYRRPIQLCHLAGLTTAAAADRLGVPRNTVLTRLSRAREILRRRLTARGAVPVLAAAVAARGVAPGWVLASTRAALDFSAGAVPAGVDGGRAAVAAGEIVQAMMWNKIKVAAAAALVATAVFGFVAGRWASADGGRDQPAAPRPAAPPLAVAAKVPDPAPAPGRRREAVVRMPAGKFVKDVDVPPYGHARLTWIYDDDRVAGLIEVSVMGVEAELTTDAEISMSKNGTIYGVLNSARLVRLTLSEGKEFGAYKPYLAFLPVAEPLVTEVLTDLPFSYQVRTSGDRLVIQNFRALLAGPNPLGKAGGIAVGGYGAILGGFQAIGVAVEGTYANADAAGKDGPKKPDGFKFKRAAAPPAGDE
jgi:RNA polymerase sigma factor (sigma-70 family)